MRIDVLTIFPEMIREAVGHSILQRAQDARLAEINAIDLRDYASDRHRTTDDTPCGGGGGMIMKPEPIAQALDALDARKGAGSARVILTEPRGRMFDQAAARELATEERLVFICGRYEGVDERVRQHLVTDEYSIGDYVLTGGELPALVMIDAIVRLIPGALGEESAPGNDSFAEPLLEYPQYTKPRSFRGWEAPEILFSGHHAQIEKWRRWHQLQVTRARRPDLWEKFAPSEADLKLLESEEPQPPK
jgi:tRNA (guanine37-N1)-methyltransferase